jgi:hypothetical protein
MFHDCKQQPITVVQLGTLETKKIRDSLNTVNQIQQPFRYHFYDKVIPLGDQHKLLDGGYDLRKAAEALIHNPEYKKLPRPLILFTSAAFGEQDIADEEGFSFYSREVDTDPQLSILSTSPWEKFSEHLSLQQYVFRLLASDLLSRYTSLSFHGEDDKKQLSDKKRCMLNYCNTLQNARQDFWVLGLCNDCNGILQNEIRKGNISVERVAATMRIYGKVIGRKHCFVAMPFKGELEPVYDAVSQVLRDFGYKVTRSDRIPQSTRITTTILTEILTSDVVIADLTGGNPNVFYEVGVAHTIGQKLLPICREGEEIPFDLKDESTIFYTNDQSGLIKLKKKLRKTL